MIQREGKLVDVIYQNDENGYRVCMLECDNEVITVVGVLPGLKLGDRIRVSGHMKQHSRYGEQFQAETYEPLLPESLEGVIEYLSSGLLPHIGEKMARRLTDAFGMAVFDVLEHEPERLQEVKGIGARRWQEIAAVFREHNALRSFIVWMGERGIDARFSMKLYQAYGEPARALIQENPYQVLESLPEIGFQKVDTVARAMGIDMEDPRRIESGIIALLHASQAEGHTCLPKHMLVERAVEALQAGEGAVYDAIESLTLLHRIQLSAPDESGDPLAYLMNAYTAETETAKRLTHLACSSPLAAPVHLPEKLEALQQHLGMTLADAQTDGIHAAFNNRLLIITGGPGTGKTTLINTLIHMLEQEGLSVLLGAPTGRAAKRMTETSGREAKTLHRLLEVAYSEEKEMHYFNRDVDNPLEADFIIIDEVSMIDIFMMQHLLEAVGPGTALVLTGDADQLPSVGPGAVLKDMIDSGLIPVVRLTEIFRQAQESMIVVNAHRINQGEPPVLNDREKDFFFIPEEDPAKALSTIQALLLKRLPEYRGFDPNRDIQVLTPTKKGLTGTRKLNTFLQQVMNPAQEGRKEKIYGERLFREGDRVMQVRNNYSLEWRRNLEDENEENGRGVFNGDLGRVESINGLQETITVLFDDDKAVTYPYALLDELEPAYAITIHKSQGSEFPVVVLPLFAGPWVLMTRNLLYTAITRARVLVVLIGSRQVLHRMVENNRIQFRYSGLGARLRQVAAFYGNTD